MKKILKSIYLLMPHILIKRKKHLELMKSLYDYSLANPTLISQSGAGTIISKNLGLEIKSPTANLWMIPKDLIKLSCNLKSYLSANLEFFKHENYKYPVAKLLDITLYFNHYKDMQKANDDWNILKEKVDYNNLFVIVCDNGLTHEEINDLNNLKCKGKILFTSKKRPEIPYSFLLKQYEKDCKVGAYSVLGKDGLRGFEREFNYANWLCGKEDLRLSNK